MVDPELLDDFMRRFFGYGSWSAKIWFVGMEEGGGDSTTEIEKRLAAWDRTDELADIRRYHAAIGAPQWFSDRPKIQNTWGKLIRVALAAREQSTQTESVRRYQRDQLARDPGSEALIELLPLPSPSTKDWLYQSFGIPPIASRELYRDTAMPSRIAAIRERIDKHQPETVIFYGVGYKRQWEAIIRTRFRSIAGQRFEASTDGPTVFVLAPHPVAKGVRNADFEAIGHFVRDQRAGQPRSQ
jgi:hypothetical protein